MSQLAEINDKFIDDYIFNHRNNLGKATMGGTDWRFADIVAPAFREVLEIVQPKRVLEVGFNAGGSALMFLSINPNLNYHSVDIQENDKSIDFLLAEFGYTSFWFIKSDSKIIKPGQGVLFPKYDLVFLDGDHSREGVTADIYSALGFDPEYILFDDVLHPSHKHIYEIITQDCKDKLEIVKMFEFNQCWSGYSMALCKVKKDI